MKKSFMFLSIVLAMCILITGCGSNEKEKVPVNSNTKNKSQNTTSKNESLNTKVNIEEKVIVERDGVKITAKSLNYNSYSVSIKVLIENSTEQNITVQAKDFSINGIMIDPLMSSDVAAGKKANSEITLDKSDLKNAKITAIKDIEFGITVFDSDSWDDIFEEEGINLQTNVTDYVQTYNTDGFLAVDQNDVKIYILKLDDKESFWGADLMVYIENNSTQPITVQSKDVSINGFMIDPIFSSDIMPGKKVYDELSFFESDLKDNDITDITDIELKFNVFNSDSWDDIFETEVLNIKF